MSSERYPPRRTAADNFLYSEDEKSDYDWLVTPPGSPSKSSTNQLYAPDATLTVALNSRLENCREEEIRDRISSKNQTIGLKRPSSANSSRSTSRPSIPDRRSTTPATRSKTPTQRVTSTGARANLTSSSTSSSRPASRASTPTRRPSSSGTSRATLTSSSTSSVRPTSRPSTPPRRPSSSGTSRANLTTARATTGTATSARSNIKPMSTPGTKPGSRSSTPTRRPPTPPGSSSTVSRSKPAKPVCKPAPSPILRSRPWEPYEMPGFSLEAPSNLRTTLPDRPQTASSCRTAAFGSSSSRSASIERTVARRQSCSPSRNRAPISNANGPGRAKTSNNGGGLISPVAKGVLMVERVVSARKLAPPRLTEKGGSNAGKSSSGADGVGFGRNLSKSSFDMALRHMDIKQGSMKGNFRQLATKVPAASLYSVRSSGTRRKRPVSSSGSSESSSANILCLDGTDDNLSDISY
ncbi:GPI-anchored protein [Hirschfeldia incana]|nr:GPI-anchored protein [Hirschfeldia incana]